MCNVIFPKCTSYKISKYFNNSKSSSRRTNFLLPNIPSSRCRAYTSDPLFRNHHCKIRSFFSYITTLIQIHAIHIDEWDGETWPRTDSKWQYGSWLSVLPHTHAKTDWGKPWKAEDSQQVCTGAWRTPYEYSEQSVPQLAKQPPVTKF